MVHSSERQRGAFEAMRPTSGDSALLLLQLRVNVAVATSWSRPHERTISSREAAGDSADTPPVSLESSGAPKKGEEVNESDGEVFEPARRNSELEEAEKDASSGAHQDDMYDDSKFTRLCGGGRVSSAAASVAFTPTSSMSALSATSSSSSIGRLSPRARPS